MHCDYVTYNMLASSTYVSLLVLTLYQEMVTFGITLNSKVKAALSISLEKSEKGFRSNQPNSCFNC